MISTFLEGGHSATATDFKFIWFGLVCLMLNVPVNNFPVILGRSNRFLGITSTLGGGGG